MLYPMVKGAVVFNEAGLKKSPFFKNAKIAEGK